MRRPDPELTSLAWEDMDVLFDAVLESSGSKAVAEGVYEGVLAAVEAVAPMPHSSPSVAGRTGIACDYRWAQHKGWLAFYHVKDNGGIIVDRVLWGKSERTKMLGLVENP